MSFPGASRQSRIPSPAEGVNRGDLLAASSTCLALHEAPTVAGETLLGTSARGDIATAMRLQLQSAGGIPIVAPELTTDRRKRLLISLGEVATSSATTVIAAVLSGRSLTHARAAGVRSPGLD